MCLPEDDTTGLVDPIVEYGHTEGIAVVGGFVNRGVAVPPLHGKYVFGDYTLPDILSGRLSYPAPGPEIREFGLGEGVVSGMSVLGFGQDADIIGKNGGDNHGVFTAHLAGGNEVPPVAGRAQGQAVVTVRNELLDVELSVTNLADIVAGNACVNVHTLANPAGAIRGQLK